MLDKDIRAREDLGLTTVFPAHEIGRRPILTEHLQDLAIALRLSLVMPSNHQAIARTCAQNRVVSRSHRPSASFSSSCLRMPSHTASVSAL